MSTNRVLPTDAASEKLAVATSRLPRVPLTDEEIVHALVAMGDYEPSDDDFDDLDDERVGFEDVDTSWDWSLVLTCAHALKRAAYGYSGGQPGAAEPTPACLRAVACRLAQFMLEKLELAAESSDKVNPEDDYPAYALRELLRALLAAAGPDDREGAESLAEVLQVPTIPKGTREPAHPSQRILAVIEANGIDPRTFGALLLAEASGRWPWDYGRSMSRRLVALELAELSRFGLVDDSTLEFRRERFDELVAACKGGDSTQHAA